MLKAVTRQASLVDKKVNAVNSQNAATGKRKISTAYYFDHFATKEDTAVMVTEEDFVEAERELVPSVSVGELEHYQSVRAQFEKVEEKDNSNSDAHDVKGKGKGKEIDGIPQWQQERPKSNGKGRGKEKVVDKKGKGKERSVGRWDEGSDDEDREFFDERVNGVLGNKGKGKGKEVDMGFQEGVEDDEDFY